MGEKQGYLSGRKEERVKRGSRHPDEIRSEIERTRSELNHTVDAIEQKISPDRFRYEFKKDLQYAGDYLQKMIREGGNALIRQTRSKNIPTALVLIGVAWLIFGITKQSRKGTEQVPYPPSTERVTYSNSEGMPYPMV